MNTLTTNTAADHGGRVEVWKAINEQAKCWAMVPSIAKMLEILRQRTAEGNPGVPRTLQELKAGYGGMMTNSFRLGFVVEMLIANDTHLSSGTGSPDAALQDWIQIAKGAERAHRTTVAWIRSRLPDYPIIRSPHLSRNTAFTTTDFTRQLAWPIEDQRAGLQNLPLPPSVGNVLGASPLIDAQLTVTNKALADALATTEEWYAFKAAAQELTSSGKEDLRAARRTLAERLSPQAVDEYEGNLAMPRANYRAFVFDEVLGTLNESALLYASTFGAVNRFIDQAASEVFAALVSQTEVPVLPSANVEFAAGNTNRIEFGLADMYGMIMECGDIAWLDDPLIADAVRFESINHSFAGTGIGNTRVGASILQGTADAWVRPSVS